MSPHHELSVVVLGAGTVGAQVVRLLDEQGHDLSARIGARLVMTGVGVRDVSRPRPEIPAGLVTADLDTLISSGPDLVVELMGGIEPAKSLILRSLRSGASVVTANKALLASHGAELHAAAREAGVDLFYEAAVAGAIPLLRPLRESLAGDRIRRVLGIVNGTTNYILTQMSSTGATFDAALAEAQALGYAEADPTDDVEGLDAAAKMAILASLAFHTRVTFDDVSVEGITAVSADDVASAAQMGYVIKLLGIAELIEQDERAAGVCVRVHPTLVPQTHPLAGVRDEFNAVFIEADAAGQVMFYGRGAGGTPTASAVLGDIVSTARHRVAGSIGPGESSYAELRVLPLGAASTAYIVHVRVQDRPGVLAAVAGVFAEHGASILSMTQRGEGEQASLLILTHLGRESDLAETVEDLRGQPAVAEVVGFMRVIGE